MVSKAHACVNACWPTSALASALPPPPPSDEPKTAHLASSTWPWLAIRAVFVQESRGPPGVKSPKHLEKVLQFRPNVSKRSRQTPNDPILVLTLWGQCFGGSTLFWHSRPEESARPFRDFLGTSTKWRASRLLQVLVALIARFLWSSRASWISTFYLFFPVLESGFLRSWRFVLYGARNVL